VTSDGQYIGEHHGYARFTIGQRRGLPGGFASPMYVVAIRPEERAVVIGPREELLGRGVTAREINWLVDPPPVGTMIHVRVRHRAPLVRGEMIRLDGDEIEIALDEPVSAITPGQSIVLYQGTAVLGGGFIEAAKRGRGLLPVMAA
jgi:tRNA-uridine 2-sulfurtransferase